MRTRFTFDPGDDLSPVFSPDGTRVAFVSDRTGQRKVYLKQASGPGEENRIGELYANSLHSWSPDGRFLLADQFVDFHCDIHTVDLSSSPATMTPVVATIFNEGHSSFSPDGKWMAYVSNESGRREVYVQSFPPARGKWQISREGGLEPQWRGDGKELFYTADDRMMAVPIRTTGEGFAAGAPQALFDLRLSSTLLRNRWVVTGDGQRFLAAIPLEHTSARSFEVIVNWPALLAKK
jgi:eukaryotic-like serine/threonine-protein kinase